MRVNGLKMQQSGKLTFQLATNKELSARFRRHNFDLQLSHATCSSHDLHAIVTVCDSLGEVSEVDLHEAIHAVWMT